MIVRQEENQKIVFLTCYPGYLISIAEMKFKPAEEFDLLGLLGAE
jgi:hypothetical protein